MNVKLFIIVSVLLISISLFGMQTSFSNHEQIIPFSPVRGDTDDYGYYWIDSNEPGGPTFSWFDTSAAWIKVNGLGDDNNVGPFPIGFSCHYYGYLVNQFWVNSNGAISFSDYEVYMPQSLSGMFIPNPNLPNDLLIPFGTDFTFQRDPDSGSCWYYTNNIDSLIVSYLDVPAWLMTGPTGSHYFQLILCKTDSTILFQYGHQHGSFYLDNDCAGIENVSGEIGLQVLYNTMPDSGYAVKFFPPYTPEWVDIGIKDAITDGSKGIFIFPDNPLILWATIFSYMQTGIETFDVSCTIMDTGSATIHYADTITLNGMVAGAETTLYFSPDWIPTVENRYFASFRARYPGDLFPHNDSIHVELEVLNTPGWLMYDSNPLSAEGEHWSEAGSKWAQEFFPPGYPMVIDSVKLAIKSSNNCDVPVLFMDDDGVNNSPGTILFTDTIYVPGSPDFNWYTVSIPASVNTITSGAFFVGFTQVGDAYPDMMMENNGPLSRRGWEFVNSSWNPYRERNKYELLIRAYTRTTGISREKEKGGSSSFSFLQVAPNPFRRNTKIQFTLQNDAEVTIKVYNLSGQEVRTFMNEYEKSGTHSVTFDAKDQKGKPLPQGIYFCRLTAGKITLIRKITVLR